jgi:hypothetical protein
MGYIRMDSATVDLDSALMVVVMQPDGDVYIKTNPKDVTPVQMALMLAKIAEKLVT